MTPSLATLVTFIRCEPGVAARLLALHIDDGTGRCAICTAGSQTGHLAWPCQTQMAAAAAAVRTVPRQ